MLIVCAAISLVVLHKQSHKIGLEICSWPFHFCGERRWSCGILMVTQASLYALLAAEMQLLLGPQIRFNTDSKIAYVCCAMFQQ